VAVLACHLYQRLDDVEHPGLVVDRRLAPIGRVPGSLGSGAITPVLAGENAAGERAPHDDANLLVDRQWDEFVLDLPVQQGVIDLLANVALEPGPL
jgi:hypothetical protein